MDKAIMVASFDKYIKTGNGRLLVLDKHADGHYKIKNGQLAGDLTGSGDQPELDVTISVTGGKKQVIFNNKLYNKIYN